MDEASEVGSDAAAPSIEVVRDGPLFVKNCERLLDTEGNALETKPQMALCRCGESKKKPFCDGSHREAGFCGDTEEGGLPDRVDTFEGKQVTVFENRRACGHEGICTEYLPWVFRPDETPRIQPDKGYAYEVERVVRKCPSGALWYSRDGKRGKDEVREPAIRVQKDRQYEVVGGIALHNPGGEQPAIPEHYILCRCGHSHRKPFCDGTHMECGFSDGK
jgi:CDGSH-type Zn-finger protein